MESKREDIARDDKWRFLSKKCPKCGDRVWIHPEFGKIEMCENDFCDYHIVGG